MGSLAHTVTPFPFCSSFQLTVVCLEKIITSSLTGTLYRPSEG